MLQEGSGGAESPSSFELFGKRGTQEVQNQVDGGTFAGDVVLQIGIEALEAKVELGCQADQHDIDVKGG